MAIKKHLISFASFLLQSPVFTAALICSVLFYSGIIQIKDRYRFSCLFPLNQIKIIEGRLASSPVKSSSGTNIYSVIFSVSNAYSGGIKVGKTSCMGNVKLLLPLEMVESLYPGKNYTAAKKGEGLLFESGGYFFMSVECVDNALPIFKVNDAKILKSENGILSSLYLLRARCRLAFKRLMYGWGSAGGLLLALLSGAKEYIEPEVGNAFKNAGLSHILALSGMHLSLFGGIAFFLGKKLSNRSSAELIQIFAVIFFVWFAGLSPSLFRAFLSSLILFVNSAMRMRRLKPLSVLATCFLIHLMIFPSHLESAAFMLSYGALAGIMSIGQLLRYFFGRLLFPAASSALSESAGAQIFTAPVTASLFGKLMPIGILSSVTVSPIIVFFLYIGLAGTILCLFMPFLCGTFSVIMSCIYFIIKELVLMFAKAPSIAFN